MQFVSRLSAASLLLAAPLAFGSSGKPLDAVDAKVSVPATQYESAFSDYVSRKVDEVGDWKEANANAGAGGGHAGHGMSHAMPEVPQKENKSSAGYQH